MASLPDLPIEVLALAQRLGASDSAAPTVALEQRGSMRASPDARLSRFTARQSIDLDRIAFEWRAKMGWLGAISVTDALDDRHGGVRVRLLGLLPIATSLDNPSVLKGEAMRYLAELPMAPDAILRNADLVWRVIDERTLVVAARGTVGGEVMFHLSTDGLVSRIEASDRPRIEGSAIVERPWRGTFTDYRRFDGRMIPARAEVSWVLPTGEFVTWEGEIMHWEFR